ncbi:MAG: hypothetical protein JOZ72_16890 [Alphaproteobacteria bacterium]|nr:hypothetical protein [Alphaproteobacteria bacterium]
MDRSWLGAIAAALISFGAQADDFHTLYAFAGGLDGEAVAGIVQDAAGNLYGTTSAGGDGACDCGTIFKLAPDGTKTLYSFTGASDGAYPLTGLAIDRAGNLYGTTSKPDRGTVFRLDASGRLTTLHAFAGAEDGDAPLGSPILDRKGKLYGTTVRGGHWGRGTVYKITPDGRERVLHAFGGTTRDGDGDGPASSLILNRDGNLYGATGYGGSSACNDRGCCATPGCGTVFKVAPDGTTTILYRFPGGSQGELPVGAVAMDKAGNLFGATEQGGVGAGNGGGLVYKLTPDGVKSDLHAFQIATGAVPHVGVIVDRRGNLYGTASGGAFGQGVAYALTRRGRYTVLHDFTDDNDPSANALILGVGGDLIGSTRAYSFECPSACGTVFRIAR